MLAAPGLSSYNFTFDNFPSNPAGAPGTSVVPGATNAEGSWTQVATGANIAYDVNWIVLRVFFGGTSGAAKNHLLDIGVDNAGGSSYTAIISNIVCGASGAVNSTANGPHVFVFPMFIKAGSTVAVRIQGSSGTAGTVNVLVKFYGQPSSPESVPVGTFSETIGTITNSLGVSFTPGNASDGTWVSLGTTTQDMWWFQLAVQINNTAILAQYCYVDLAYGDASNKILIQRQMTFGGTAEIFGDALSSNLLWLDAYRHIPAGATLYVRGRNSGAPETGWNAVAIGIGG